MIYEVTFILESGLCYCVSVEVPLATCKSEIRDIVVEEFNLDSSAILDSVRCLE